MAKKNAPQSKPPPAAKYDRTYKLWGLGQKVDGEPDGVWVWYAKTGTRVLQQTWRSGRQVAERRWYPDGTLMLVQAIAKSGAITLVKFYIHPEGKWREELQPHVTFNSARLPASVREVREVRRQYPLTYEFFDSEGKRVGDSRRLG